MRITRSEICYEVWTEPDPPTKPEMIAAYWDVLEAWKVGFAVESTGTPTTVIVASGMQVDIRSGIRSPRPSVIGTQPKEM